MAHGKGWYHTVGVCALLAAVLLATPPGTLRAEGMGDDKFKPGDTAPDFIAKDFAGKEVKLSSYAGKNVVLLNFWGVRCGACLEEMPYLDAIGKKYADKGLVVLGIDTDGIDAKTARETLTEVKVSVSYPLFTDEDFKITDVYTNFLVPLTLVIDKGGVVRYIHTGFEKGTEKHYEAAVKKALGI
ncbi:MAG: TlpA disulfide reductase family protein [Candidatus Methylomirabilia bacterium]